MFLFSCAYAYAYCTSVNQAFVFTRQLGLPNLNLPRSMRFKWENIIVVGIIPGLDKEPGSINEFLARLVKEMKALWNGVYLK